MLTVALTGNIASGKSEVAKVWRGLGAHLVDADELSRRAVEPGTPGLRAIVERWGPEMLAPDGTLDRAALRDIVFRDSKAREELETIVHPRVRTLRDEAFAAARAEGAPLIVADIPLLFETGLEAEFDVVVLVDAPESVRRARLVDLRGIDADEAARMIAAQMPAEEKRSRAGIVIENTGTLEDLRVRATAVWRGLQARAEAAS